MSGGDSERRAVHAHAGRQVGVDEATVSGRQNCGNLLAGVGPFAVERGLAAASPVRIHMVNSGSVATATFPAAGTSSC